MLLIAFFKDSLKCFKNSGAYLLVSHSVSDCLTSLCAPFCQVYFHTDIVNHFATILVANSSFLSITSISIDCFLMVTLPIKHRIYVKGKVMAIWIAAIWMLHQLCRESVNLCHAFGKLSKNILLALLQKGYLTQFRNCLGRYGLIIVSLMLVMFNKRSASTVRPLH